MTGAPLWRGYWFLFASTSAAAFIMQIDLAMVARLGGRASGAYAILMRVTLLRCRRHDRFGRRRRHYARPRAKEWRDGQRD